MDTQLYMPISIVAKDLEGNFIHMREAEENQTYYCPICNGDMKIRAVDSTKVQKHYYHLKGEGKKCNESMQHWICKNWSFTAGSKFYADKDLITVKEIIVEKTYFTTYGYYKPDITIITDQDKVIFAEINYSNKKDTTYANKWSELGNDVIEADVHELINSEYLNDIPRLKYIFKDGQYTSSYEKQKRADIYADNVIAYKNTISKDVSRYARIDNVFQKSIDYRFKRCTKDDVISAVDELEKYEDKVWYAKLAKRIKCSDIYEELKDRLNKEFKEKIESHQFQNDRLRLILDKKSKQIYSVSLVYDFIYNEELFFRKQIYEITFRVYADLIDKNHINESIEQFEKYIVENDDEILNVETHFNKFKNLLEKYDINFIDSHNKYNLYNLDCIVNKNGCEIAKFSISYFDSYDAIEKKIINVYDIYVSIDLFINSIEYKALYSSLKSKCRELYIEFKYKPCEAIEIQIYIDREYDFSLIIMKSDFNSYDKICKSINEKFKEKYLNVKELEQFAEEINNCKNKFWFAKVNRKYFGSEIEVGVVPENRIFFSYYCCFDLKTKIIKSMNEVLDSYITYNDYSDLHTKNVRIFLGEDMRNE